MKVLPLLSGRQNNPQQPVKTGIRSFMSFRRSAKSLPGALLFLFFIAAMVYASAPSASKPIAAKSTSAANQLRITQNAAQSTSEVPVTANIDNDTAPAPEPTNAGVSTHVSTVNGHTKVTVNGQPVATDNNGSVSKTVTTDDGSVHINVSQTNTTTGNGSSYGGSSYNASTNSEVEQDVSSN